MSTGNRKSAMGPSAGGRRGREAFTLIEVLLAIGILALGITAVLFLFSMGARSHRRAIDRTRAALLADTVVNDLRASFPPDDPPALPPNATHLDFPGFTYDVAFAQLPDSQHYYRVSVLVRWGSVGAPPDPRNSETYETILQRPTF